MKKKHFSVYLAKSSFQNGILKITGMKKTVLIFLILFLIGCFYMLSQKTPLIVEVGIWLSIGILLWGIYDVIFSRMQLTYQADSRWLSIRRKKGRYLFRYEGSSDGKLNLKVKKALSTDNHSVESFNLILVFEDDRHYIPFVLETFDMNAETVAHKKEQWIKELKL